jgi:uncharacterized membrane protein YphA (DoxX/SURF4 family)
MENNKINAGSLLQQSAFHKFNSFAWFKRSTVIEVISSLLIILFIYAALNKLSDFELFKVQLSKSPFITSFSNFVAWSIPISEIVIALLLVIKRTRLIGLYASFFLMSLFTAYLVIMLNLSYYIPCSCGGVLEKLSWDQHIVFNGVFVLFSGIGVMLNTTK